jgi:hypothetical protein
MSMNARVHSRRKLHDRACLDKVESPSAATTHPPLRQRNSSVGRQYC